MKPLSHLYFKWIQKFNASRTCLYRESFLLSSRSNWFVIKTASFASGKISFSKLFLIHDSLCSVECKPVIFPSCWSFFRYFATQVTVNCRSFFWNTCQIDCRQDLRTFAIQFSRICCARVNDCTFACLGHEIDYTLMKFLFFLSTFDFFVLEQHSFGCK